LQNVVELPHEDSFANMPNEYLFMNNKGNSTVLLAAPRFTNITDINQNNPIWFKQHKNTNYTEFIYIQEGCGEFIIEGKPYSGQEGDLIIFNPFTTTEERSNPDNPIKGISICFSHLHINGRDKGCITDSKDVPVIHLQEEKLEISNYISEISSEYSNKNVGYQDMINSLLQAVIIKIYRLLGHTHKYQESSICQEVKKCIEENVSQKLTLNDLASHVHVSPYHLIHIFKEEVGMAPIQYLIHCRILEAKRFLEQSNLSVRDIGLIIGYENENYFNLLFKKMVGIPPGKYRKIKRAGSNNRKGDGNR
jgi:AraC-like DNA-binding protein